MQCWGSNVEGSLGVGYSDSTFIPESCPNSGACSTTPVPVAGLPPIAHVAAHFGQVCAVGVDGHAYCWGTPSQTSPASVDVCGSQNPICVPVPKMVQGVEQATSIAVGYGHACVLTTASQVLCWGLDTHGQLGRGNGPDWDPTPATIVIPPEP